MDADPHFRFKAMFALKISQPLLNSVQKALDFNAGLKIGHPDLWSQFTSPEIGRVKEQWKHVKMVSSSPAPAFALTDSLTKSEMRQVARALALYIAAHDGRYSLLVDHIDSASAQHPNPFRLGIALAEAETERQMSRISMALNGLEYDDEQALRLLSDALNKAFVMPCPVLPDLRSFGVHAVDSREDELCL